MRTIKNILNWGILIFIMCCMANEAGIGTSKDADYLIDNSNLKIAIPNQDTSKIKLLTRDTTPYQGNWVDPQY